MIAQTGNNSNFYQQQNLKNTYCGIFMQPNTMQQCKRQLCATICISITNKLNKISQTGKGNTVSFCLCKPQKQAKLSNIIIKGCIHRC